jgi:hypothetical protein
MSLDGNAMVDDDDVELEHSPLSGELSRDGITIRVEIFRVRDDAACWSLEVVDQEGASTVWDSDFPIDQDAYREFYRTLESEGMRTFLEQSPRHVH